MTAARSCDFSHKTEDNEIKYSVSDFEDTTKDLPAKQILSYRIVLAYILKYSVRDFQNYEIHTLEEMIEPDPSNPALANLNATEDVQGNLAVIEFDIRTSVNGSSAVELFLDVEAQRDLHPTVENSQGRHTYSLAQRAVYYVSRMLSSQLSLRNNDYAGLKPCYTKATPHN